VTPLSLILDAVKNTISESQAAFRKELADAGLFRSDDAKKKKDPEDDPPGPAEFEETEIMDDAKKLLEDDRLDDGDRKSIEDLMRRDGDEPLGKEQVRELKECMDKIRSRLEASRHDATPLASSVYDLTIDPHDPVRLDSDPQVGTLVSGKYPYGEVMAILNRRADHVAMHFGQTAKMPMMGELPLDYRIRTLRSFQPYSPTLCKFDLRTIRKDSHIAPIEAQIFRDAIAASLVPAPGTSGQLREVKRRDQSGRLISEFHGDTSAWLRHFMPGKRSVTKIGQL
jgi:hypothetical protein